MTSDNIVFICDCGQNYYYRDDTGQGGGTQPCFCSVIRELDIVDLIAYLSDTFLLMAHVKYDRFRENNKWTVVMGNMRIGDTDDPKKLLYDWACSEMRESK